MSIRQGNNIIAGNPNLTNSNGEIGDIGFAPFGIDESLNLRRYLNGQVISQTQFASFTTKLKAAIILYPSLATTEVNWQAEVTNSVLGQCGKFVIDDNAGIIRLPKVVNINGLINLSNLGTIKAESLPNITGSFSGIAYPNSGESNSAIYTSAHIYTGATNGWSTYSAGDAGAVVESINASRSSSAYQNNAPVQEEAIQYPYYIQVALGVKETLPAIREYKVNNSDFFGKSMYSDVAPDNASWLVSNGQYNSKTVYPKYYNWLLEHVNDGIERFLNYEMYAYSPSGSSIVFTLTTTTPKIGMTCYGWSDGSYDNIPISTIISVNQDGTFVASYQGTNYTFERNSEKDQSQCYPTDYDWVVNQSDETFRLPLLDGSEDLEGSVYENLTLQASASTYTSSKNGKYVISKVATSTGQYIAVITPTYQTGRTAGVTNETLLVEIEVIKGDTITISYNAAGTTNYFRFIPAIGNGSLYYYVGDTIQDVSLINAGQILNALSNKVGYEELQSCHAIVETYKNGESWYKVYDDGWVEQGGIISFTNGTGFQKIYYLKPYASNPNIQITLIGCEFNNPANLQHTCNAQSRTPTYFTSYVDSNVPYKSWFSCGQGATS